MRRVTELIRNLLGLDDGATTSLAQLEEPTPRVRWRIAVGACLVLGVAVIVVAIVVSSVTGLGAPKSLPGDLLPSSSASELSSENTAEGSAASGQDASRIFVHIVGAVTTPGLYSVIGDARVFDAVMAAGGLAATADLCAINLALNVSDGDYIVVATRAEGGVASESECTGSAQGVQAPVGGPVDGSAGGGTLVSLSRAGIAELDTLPGIGPALAQRIVDWREVSGGFTNIEQLTEVSGIGDKVMDNIRDLVTL